jgi:chromosomal replication initiation ATPase DnaA
MTLDEQIESMRAKMQKHWRPKSKVVEKIQAAAIAVFDVEAESFFNGERTRPVSHARMASMIVSRQKTGLPVSLISKLHGGMDHAMVSYAEGKLRRGGFKHDFEDAIEEIKRLIEEA